MGFDYLNRVVGVVTWSTVQDKGNREMIFFFQWLHLFIVVYFPAVEILQHCRVLCYQIFVFLIISLQTNNCSPKTSRNCW